ncbi:MAG: CD225/dispanin family protein [Oligosphaeraceae bacterium]
MAILTTFCCCPILGVVAIVFSVVGILHQRKGEDKAAERCASFSFWLSAIGVILSLAILARHHLLASRGANQDQEQVIRIQETLPGAEEEPPVEPVEEREGVPDDRM